MFGGDRHCGSGDIESICPTLQHFLKISLWVHPEGPKSGLTIFKPDEYCVVRWMQLSSLAFYFIYMLNLGFSKHNYCFLKMSKLHNVDSILIQAWNQRSFTWVQWLMSPLESGLQLSHIYFFDTYGQTTSIN